MDTVKLHYYNHQNRPETLEFSSHRAGYSIMTDVTPNAIRVWGSPGAMFLIPLANLISLFYTKEEAGAPDNPDIFP